MKKKITLLLSGLMFITTQSFGQGSPSIKIFANYNSDMESDFKEFEIKRSYIGYSYSFDDEFAAKVTFDIGSNSGGSAYTAYLKIASLNWKTSEKISLDFGMIGTKNFKFMEKSWGKRYIEKSALDKYKWANSADAGVSGTLKVSERISIDGQIINGEGYKKTQVADGLFRSGAGLTVKITDNVSCRFFRDNLPTPNPSPSDTLDDGQLINFEDQTITSAALTYKGSNYNIGIERSQMEHQDHLPDAINRNIMSLYGSVDLAGNSIFVRRDIVSSSDDNVIQSGDGEFTIFGIERQMRKGIKIALNMQNWQNETIEGDPEAERERSMFLNLECKF